MATIKNWLELRPDQRIERFEEAVRVMTAMKPHARARHFDMGRWGERTKCGTVACAAGHCALDPWFRKQGLTIKGLDNGNCAIFFGWEANERIFVSADLYELSGVKGHRAALKRMRTYLGYLKAQRAIQSWT